MKVRIITNKGYKYEGERLSEDNIFIKINDNVEGKIKIPVFNISYVKEFDREEKNGE